MAIFFADGEVSAAIGKASVEALKVFGGSVDVKILAAVLL